ncbi:MAG: bifunctional phosphopantothenoylcysteine decarboxylase/phosphopantothenate--cysteine ligase CoaBC [FCB group bacterium]|nr:bifunctional phosphopantothenoylcysteine decarboxylase/phosphopantothenate--cysteine ligase CoaBC [FCB group bacterium]
MSIFKGKNILLGVTGSIAAYKACEIVRLLTKAGARVQVIMTHSGTKMVGPATFAALTGRDVLTELFPKEPKAGLEHIHLAETLDVIIVAPATANIIAKTAHGIADDLLSTTLLACDVPKLFAPAMNFRMWRNEATQSNLAIIRQRGATIVDPEHGQLASLAVGEGRMAEPKTIVNALRKLLGGEQDYEGQRVLITAGPTREPIDPVRFLSNRSSGKMGYALAAAALERGARVTLISGPTALEPPAGCDFIAVETAEEMEKQVRAKAPDQELIIMAAAVADFRIARPETRKIKRGGSTPVLKLEPNPDILKGLRPLTDAYLVGFALEVEKGRENALKKLREKQLDAIFLNYADRADSGFDKETNEGILFFKDSEEEVPFTLQSKKEIAHGILTAIREDLKRET